jgi:hypothetical protein
MAENDYGVGGSLGRMREKTTLGWQPSCECNAGDPIPCIVLDPFGGSGTVLEVCRMNNRQGLCIELNPDYEPLIRERSMANITSIDAFGQAGGDAE